MLLQEGRPQGPPLDRNQMSQGNNYRSPPPRPQYRQTNTRRDWGKQYNSYPQNTRFYQQGGRSYDHPPQGNPRWQGEESLPQPSSLSHAQPDNGTGGADWMKVSIPETKNEASKTEKPHCRIGNEDFQTIHPIALLTSIDGTQTDKVEEPVKEETKSQKCCICKCQIQNTDLETKETEIVVQETIRVVNTPLEEVNKEETKKEESKTEEIKKKEKAQEKEK